MKFVDLVREAPGCVLPDAGTHCLGPVGDDVAYDVYLWDWQVCIRVPLPAMTVAVAQTAGGVPVNPTVYKVRPQDAIAYALASFDVQPQAVQAHLRGRFAALLPRARELAARYWAGERV